MTDQPGQDATTDVAAVPDPAPDEFDSLDLGGLDAAANDLHVDPNEFVPFEDKPNGSQDPAAATP